MTPERARELLGGLSTGILTPEERQTLFEAALHDQALFNEVADELEFGAFLQDAGTRAQLANRIEVEPVRRQWWALRPRWLAVVGVTDWTLRMVESSRPATIPRMNCTQYDDWFLGVNVPAVSSRSIWNRFENDAPTAADEMKKNSLMRRGKPDDVKKSPYIGSLR